MDCPVTVLVFCSDPQVAAWYAEPITTTLSGYVFQAEVCGPDDIPVIADPKEVAALPEMAVLSVVAHGARRDVAEAFMSGLASLNREHAPEYYEHAYNMSVPLVQRILEGLMSSTDWPVYSPFAREHFGRGKAEGEAQGKAEGEARIVLMVLEARGVSVPESVRARISECTDLGQLELWARRAATAGSIEELFLESE